MKPIDAAIKDLEMIGDCRTCGNKTPFCDSSPDSCKGYKWRGALPRSAAEENSPLTLEGLREMDGDPVWVERPGCGARWALVQVWAKSTSIIYLTCNNGMVLHTQPELESGAKIYRRKPEDKT